MSQTIDAWLVRAKGMISARHASGEVIQCATSFVAAVYGPQSVQLNAFTTSLAQIAKSAKDELTALTQSQGTYARGVIENTIAEVEDGLIVSLRAIVAERFSQSWLA
jgi:hypothetical protein